MALSKKQTNWLIYGSVGLLLVAAIVFIVYRLRKSRPQLPTSSNLSGGGNSASSYTDAINRDLRLKKGDRGNNVVELQKKLNTRGAGLVADGIFGNATKAAIAAQVATPTYYETNGISWNELNSEQTASQGSTNGSGYTPPTWTPADTTGVGNYGGGSANGVYDPMGYWNGVGG